MKYMDEELEPTEVDEFSVMTILNKFKSMEKKKAELAETHRKAEQEK